MKKFIAGFLCCLMLFGVANAAEQFTDQKAKYDVVVAGKAVNEWGDVPPMNVNGRTMLPLAKTGEILGVNVKWDGKQVVIGDATPIPVASPTVIPPPAPEVTMKKEIVYNQSMLVDGLKIEVSELLDKNISRTYSVRITNTSKENKEYSINNFWTNVGNPEDIPEGLKSGTLKPGEVTESLVKFDNSQQIATDRVMIYYMKITNRVIIDDLELF